MDEERGEPQADVQASDLEAAALLVPFGARLRKARKSRGWTLAYVAGKMGTSITYISDIERGKRHPMTQIRADLCKLLDVADDAPVAEVVKLRIENAAMVGRLNQKDAAINELCHELRGQLGELVLLAGGVYYYLDKGQPEKARARAVQLEQRLKARDAVIVAGRDRALGV